MKWAVDVSIEGYRHAADIVDVYMAFSNIEIKDCFVLNLLDVIHAIKEQIIAVTSQGKTVGVSLHLQPCEYRVLTKLAAHTYNRAISVVGSIFFHGSDPEYLRGINKLVARLASDDVL
jgi:hypothetical protein